MLSEKQPSPLMTFWQKRIAELQATGMEQCLSDSFAPKEVNRVHHGPKQIESILTTPQSTRSSTCRQCGLIWPHKMSPCPAKGRTCRKCEKSNHFAKMCLSKPKAIQQTQCSHKSNVNYVTQIESASSSDDEYLYTMRQDENTLSIPKISIEINEVTVDMIVDTGASTDILDEVTYCRINHRLNIKLQPSTKCLFAYGSESQLAVLGNLTP